ncbi:hypothetical protein T10_9238 [Trichinella papuae]|uniref:Uncharacterized protein n=1 Tax=Trichinella papuae TaxID=268474 RepID=A0A0V1M858_9BILA|nr:hypothetical protein T10_9238 [Trichinella papuae]
MAPQDIDIVQTKQSYSRIHSHRKMHGLDTTLWPNSNTGMNAFAIIKHLFDCSIQLYVGQLNFANGVTGPLQA